MSEDDFAGLDHSQPHDSLFKRVFGQREHAESELRSVLPAELVALLDFQTLDVMPGEYRDEALRGSQSDLLFRTKLSGEEAYVYVLFEHQSSRDPWLPLRLLTYMCRVFERVKREEKGRVALPPMIPVVLYHGEGTWTHELRFADLYVLPEALRALPSIALLDFSARVDDLTAQTSRALATRTEANAFVKLVLLVLKRARFATDLLAELEAWLEVLHGVNANTAYTEDSQSVFWYIHEVAEVPPDEIRALLTRVRATRLRDMATTTAEKLRQEGRAEGRQEGILEGATRAKRELLRKLMRGRFGEVPAAVVDCLDAATESELDVWAERVLSAASAEDVVAK